MKNFAAFGYLNLLEPCTKLATSYNNSRQGQGTKIRENACRTDIKSRTCTVGQIRLPHLKCIVVKCPLKSIIISEQNFDTCLIDSSMLQGLAGREWVNELHIATHTPWGSMNKRTDSIVILSKRHLGSYYRRNYFVRGCLYISPLVNDHLRPQCLYFIRSSKSNSVPTESSVVSYHAHALSMLA